MTEHADERRFDTTTDKPRKIVVCHPEDFVSINAAVMELGYGDVLVRPNRHVEVGKAYVVGGGLLYE